MNKLEGERHDQQKKPKGTMKVKNADRAMDNMFRIVLANHLQLSAMADNKANMIITVSSLIITLSLGSLDDPSLMPTILGMAITCLGTIVCAIFATLPKLTPQLTPPINSRDRSFNLLFFGFFTQLDFEMFHRELETVINDRSMVYESLTKDLYGLGRVLEKKYKYIRYSYLIFMVGLTISILILVITLSTGNSSSTPPA